MGYGLTASFFANGFIEFVEIEFLAADLRYFDLGDALGSPILLEVLFKSIGLF